MSENRGFPQLVTSGAGSSSPRPVKKPKAPEKPMPRAFETMEPRTRMRMEQYHRSVEHAMQQPIISVAAAADAAVGALPQNIADGAADSIAARLNEAYPDGYMSISDFIRESKMQPHIQSVLAYEGRVDPQKMAAFRKFTEAQAAEIEQRSAVVAQKVADQIGQKSYDESVEPVVQMVRGLVAAHSPRGEYAPYAHRTYSENAEVAKNPNVADPNYYLTDEGVQNHRALRVGELFSAGDPNYAPASFLSGQLKLYGGIFGPYINYFRGLNNTPEAQQGLYQAHRDWETMGRDGGKFEYATELYQRGLGDSPEQQRNVYTEGHLPKFYAYDPTNQYGAGQAMFNTSFPLARLQNNTAPVREVALHLGNNAVGEALDIGNTTIPELASGLRRLRRENRAITPVVPDSFDPKQHRELGEKLDKADSRMEGMLSATWGPRIDDAINGIARHYENVYGMPAGSLQRERGYMTPAFQTLLSIPGEAFSDPINLAANLTVPGVYGAVTGGVRGLATSGIRSMVAQGAKDAFRGMATAPLRLVDDAVEESIEGNVTGPAAMGVKEFITPEKDNLMMRGWQVRGADGQMRQGKPSDPGHDAEVERRHIQARVDQMEATDQYNKARREAAAKEEQRKMDEQRSKGRAVQVGW